MLFYPCIRYATINYLSIEYVILLCIGAAFHTNPICDLFLCCPRTSYPKVLKDVRLLLFMKYLFYLIILVVSIVLFIPVASSYTGIYLLNITIHNGSGLNIPMQIGANNIQLTGAQTTLNYDAEYLQFNWIRKGDFLYYAKEDYKIFYWRHFIDAPDNGYLTILSMELMDYSVAQEKIATLATVNFRPVKKGVTYIYLNYSALIAAGPDILINQVDEDTDTRIYTINII